MRMLPIKQFYLPQCETRPPPRRRIMHHMPAAMMHLGHGMHTFSENQEAP